MPRCAREKAEDSIFHIMVKSIKEVPLFRENKDKDLYLNILKGYQEIYGFKVYGYCLMDNHAHFIIDVNGADISKIMHSINFKYAMCFNRKYDRSGHLFQDRFRSKIVTNERYLIALSAYIHNNPLSIKKYKDCPEKFKYSSLGVYLGLKVDPFDIIDRDFILQLFGCNKATAREHYIRLVYKCSDKNFKKEIEFEEEATCYRSERKILVRDFTPGMIFMYLEEKTGIDKDRMHIKNKRSTVEARAFAALLMRHLCNFRCSDICRVLGNITQQRVSKLCSRAYDLLSEEKYKGIIKEFIDRFAA